MAFFTNLNSWTKSLYLITISKWIDLKMSAWRHFVDNELYFYFSHGFASTLMGDFFLLLFLRPPPL